MGRQSRHLFLGPTALAVLALGANHPAKAAELIISDQSNEFTVTHSDLPLTITGNGPGTLPVSIIQGNGSGDVATIENGTFKSIRITQGTGVNDKMVVAPESEIGGILDFSGTWSLLPGDTPTTGSFAEVAYAADGSVADLLTWSIASAGTNEASITGMLCTEVTPGAFPCTVPTDAAVVGPGPNSISNTDLTASWISDRAVFLPEPASMAVLATGLGALGLIRRRKG